MKDDVSIKKTDDGFEVLLKVASIGLGDSPSALGILSQAHQVLVQQMTIESSAESADEQIIKLTEAKTEVVAIVDVSTPVPAVPVVP